MFQTTNQLLIIPIVNLVTTKWSLENHLAVPEYKNYQPVMMIRTQVFSMAMDWKHHGAPLVAMEAIYSHGGSSRSVTDATEDDLFGPLSIIIKHNQALTLLQKNYQRVITYSLTINIH